MKTSAAALENPRCAERRFSKTGKSVLWTGVDALVLFPLFAAVKAAGAAVRKF